MAWTLSCLQLKKVYSHLKLELYTDIKGKELLIDTLGLPYDKVHVVLDSLNCYHEDLWAVGKIKTYSLQTEPFIHVDGDVFIWQRIFDGLFASDLFVQSIDNTAEYYSKSANEVLENFKFVPEKMKSNLRNPKEVYGINAGIIGGNNISFIKDYSFLAFRLIDDNLDVLNQINRENFNMFYEQYLFSFLQRQKGIRLTVLFQELSEGYKEIIDMSMIPYHHYNHIIADAKKNLRINEQVAIRLKLNHPYYFKLVDNHFSYD